jgi:hypothetical protein
MDLQRMMKHSAADPGRKRKTRTTMKTSTLVTALGLFAGVLSAEPVAAVTVNFVDTDNFTDFSDSYSFPDRGRVGYVEDLSDYIASRAAKKLPAGLTLQVVVTDIDMAGEFEPWRSSSGRDVRIIKDLYPPRIDLSFRIVDASGAVVAEGNRKLRDMSFMFTGRALDGDPLKYEKRLLDRWIAKELGRGLEA